MAPPASPAPASSPRRDGAGTAWQVSCRSVDLARELSFDTAPSLDHRRNAAPRTAKVRFWLASPAGRDRLQGFQRLWRWEWLLAAVRPLAGELRPKQTDLVPGKGPFGSRFRQSAQLRLSDNDFSGGSQQPTPTSSQRNTSGRGLETDRDRIVTTGPSRSRTAQRLDETSAWARRVISSAARRVKVSSRRRCGSAPSRIRCASR